jgi:hypothetical protein
MDHTYNDELRLMSLVPESLLSPSLVLALMVTCIFGSTMKR